MKAGEIVELMNELPCPSCGGEQEIYTSPKGWSIYICTNCALTESNTAKIARAMEMLEPERLYIKGLFSFNYKEKGAKPDTCRVGRYVPYQLCPLCLGQGEIAAGYLSMTDDGKLVSTGTDTKPCHTCKGEGVIAMCEIKGGDEQ